MAQINEISKSLPKKLELTLKDCEASEVFMRYKKQHPTLFDAMYRLEGTIDHVSQHAAGVLITPKPIREFVPALYDHKLGMLVSGYDKYMLEELGLYKFDILKLTTLNVIDDTIKNIKENKNVEIDFKDISRDDVNVYDTLCAGNVFGVFQLEDQASLTAKLQPKDFEALTALEALIRPGVGDIETYTRRMNGEKFEYYHESEKPYMAPTFNTITYQEQFMLRVHTLAGWTLGKGDSLRKVKKIGQDEDLRQRFRLGCKEVGYITDDSTIEKAWREIVEALEGGYSFNKSHAASYADISYQTAWLKHFYPVEFMAALMTSERADQAKIAERINQCKLLNIKILPPDINKSDVTYKVEGDAIRFAINTIKGVGDTALLELSSILSAGRIPSFSALLDRGNLRILDKTVCTNLIKAGCFDYENTNRYQLLRDYHVFRKEKKVAELYEGKTCEGHDIARMEKEVLGMYLTHSPFDDYNFKSIDEFPQGTSAYICGEIVKITEKFDKNNRKMAFVTLATQYNNVELVIFSSTFPKVKDAIAIDNLVAVKGKNDGNNKMIVDSINILI